MKTLRTGKWQKHKQMMANIHLVEYLPETMLLSEQSFHSLLQKYRKVVLKPDVGALGAGIVVVTSISPDQYVVQMRHRKWHYENARQCYAGVKRITKGRDYVIQQYLYFAKVNNRLFDIRIMTQLNEHSRWIVTGMLTKVAYKGYAVTNPEEFVRPVESVLQKSSLGQSSVDHLMNELERISLEASRQLELSYPGLKIIGFDVGIDTEGHIWIIEPNFAPAIYWFKQLPELKTYKNIIYYKQIVRNKKASTMNSAPAVMADTCDEFYYYS